MHDIILVDNNIIMLLS